MQPEQIIQALDEIMDTVDIIHGGATLLRIAEFADDPEMVWGVVMGRLEKARQQINDLQSGMISDAEWTSHA